MRSTVLSIYTIGIDIIKGLIVMIHIICKHTNARRAGARADM